MIIGVNMIPLYAEKGSGAFRYIRLIIQELRGYDLSEHKFIVYKQKCISKEYLGLPSNLNVEYVDVPNVGSGFKRILFEQTLFYKYIKKCDVFYCYCSSLPVFLKIKKVFTLHDVYFITERERYGFIQRNYLKFITWVYIHISYKILTVSEFSKKEIIKYYHVAPERVLITYNFVKPTPKIEKIDTVEDQEGKTIDLSKPYFLYVGNIHPGKNIVRMVEGFDTFNKKEGKYQLLVCGKAANDGEAIIDKIKDYKNVSYLGYQRREVVDYLFQNCVAVVLVSLCEGFGIPPLEGIQSHKPALVSSGTSIPEVIGKAGVCVNPLDVDDIAKGFQSLLDNYDSFDPFYDIQVEKFSPKVSVETWMNTLGIKTK